MSDVIICGSRRYERNLDNLVDSFEVIVRHNMLVSNCGYGKRDSTIQVMNNHVHKNYKRKLSLKNWKDHYSVKQPSDEHVEKFYNYIHRNTDTRYVTYHHNNTNAMKQVCSKHGVRFTCGHLKCGLAYVAECIKEGKKPFLIGYSISEDTVKDHQYNNHTKLFRGHDHSGETRLIQSLHKKGLIDASFCLLLEDRLSEEFIPTEESKLLMDKYLC